MNLKAIFNSIKKLQYQANLARNKDKICAKFGVDGKIFDPNGGEVPLHVDLKEKKDKQNGND